MTTETLLTVLCLLIGVLIALVGWLLKTFKDIEGERREEEQWHRDELLEAILTGQRGERQELQTQLVNVDRNQRQAFTNLMAFVTDQQGKSAKEVKSLNDIAQKSLNDLNGVLHQRLLELQHLVDERLRLVEQSQQSSQLKLQDRLHEQMDALRQEMETSLEKIRTLNESKLEAMRNTVEHKLDQTLSTRLTASFKMVDDKLAMMQHGLGEMRSIAASVRDLKGVLTNVKNRGTFGETQLEVLLSDLLTPEQFEAQCRVIPGSNAQVDFAIRMPGAKGEAPCWLPIDSKFPVEDYERLLLALEAGDQASAEAARKALERAVLIQAKSIHDKYVKPPFTTEFAIMYFPSEGLYAEVLRLPGCFEKLQRDFRITPVGPTVLSALINALQMGFVTLALQERSSEVWKVLAEVKSEFLKFADSLSKVQKKFSEAQSSLEAMQTRHNVMQKAMASIETAPVMGGAALAQSDNAQNELGAPEVLPTTTDDVPREQTLSS